jgi:hypothetical protein
MYVSHCIHHLGGHNYQECSVRGDVDPLFDSTEEMQCSG